MPHGEETHTHSRMYTNSSEVKGSHLTRRFYTNPHPDANGQLRKVVGEVRKSKGQPPEYYVISYAWVDGQPRQFTPLPHRLLIPLFGIFVCVTMHV